MAVSGQQAAANQAVPSLLFCQTRSGPLGKKAGCAAQEIGEAFKASLFFCFELPGSAVKRADRQLGLSHSYSGRSTGLACQLTIGRYLMFVV